MSKPTEENLRSHAPSSLSTSSASSFLFGLYCVYLIFFFLNIPSRFPVLGVLRPTLLLLAALLGLLFLEKLLFENKDISNTSKLINRLLIYMCLSLPFVEWPGSVLSQNLPRFIKAIVFFFFTVKIVDSLPRLRIFISLFVFTHLVRALEPLYLHLTQGYWGSQAHLGGGEFMARLAGAPADIINPNGLALVVVTCLAFVHYLWGGSQKFLIRLAYVLIAPALLYVMVLTGSRSGLVALGVLALTIFVKSNRKLVLIVVGVAGLSAAWPNLTPDQQDRYLSIFSDDTRNASTAGTRSGGVVKDLALWQRNPIFGYGVGTSKEAHYNFGQGSFYSHVLYTEVLVDIGLIGFLLYIPVLVSIVKNYFSAKKMLLQAGHNRLIYFEHGTDYDYLLRLADSIHVWVVMGLVFSLAQYGLSEYNWYFIGGVSVVVYRLAVFLNKSVDDPQGKVADHEVARIASSTRSVEARHAD